MTATITQGWTLLAFSNGDSYILYGENARKASKVLDHPTVTTAKGIEYLQITGSYRYTAEPKLVAAGYRLAILEA